MRRPLGIGVRIAATVGTVVVLSSFAIGYWTCDRFTRALARRELAALLASTRASAQHFASALESLRQEAAGLAALVSSATAGRLDFAEAPASSDPAYASWCTELADLVTRTIAGHPELVEVRFVPFEPSRRPAVRIVPGVGTPTWTPLGAADGPPIEAGIAARVRAGRVDEVHMTSIRWWRGDRAPGSVGTPVVQATVAICDSSGRRAGALTLVADVRPTIAALGTAVPPGRSLYIANEHGRLLLQPIVATWEDRTPGWHGESSVALAALDFEPGPDGSAERSEVVTAADGTRMAVGMHAVRLQAVRACHVWFVTVMPHADLVAVSTSIRNRSFAGGMVLMFASLVVSLLLSRSLTAPLSRMTRAVEAFRVGRRDIDLPVDSRHEAGVLARSFCDVIAQVNDRTDRLQREAASRARAELALASANAQLKQKNEALEEFVFSASHDLKSPLVTFLGYLNYLRRDLDEGRGDRLAGFVDALAEAAHGMQRNVDDLLALSRIGVVAHDTVVVDLREVIASAVRVLDAQISARDVHIDVRAPLLPVRATRIHVAQAVQNLLSNAIKYGCAEPGATVTIGTRRVGGAVHLYVVDHGPGVPGALSERIFGLFQRLDTRPEGTGVGLAIVKRVAQIHGGRAWVEPTEGGGATFRVSLPSAARVAAA